MNTNPATHTDCREHSATDVRFRENSLEKTISKLVVEKSGERLEEEKIDYDSPLGSVGLSILETFEVIVSLEDQYDVSIDDTDGTADTWTITGLANCIKGKLIQKANETITWKDSLESLVFTCKTPALKTPLTIHLDPTFRCNAKCVFCYDASGTDKGLKEMTLDEWKGVLDECSDMDVVEITFGGGEPFIRKDFLDIVRYTKQQNIRIYILSNGTLITPEIACELNRCLDKRFDNVQVSLDGPEPGVHDRQRGIKGLFHKTMKGIRNLQAVGISPVINTVATQNNYEHIPRMIPFLLENGLSRFRVLRLHPLGRGKDLEFFNEWRLKPEQSEFLFEHLNNKRQELIGQMHISNDNACIFPMSAEKIRSNLVPLPGQEPDNYACGAGTTRVSIGPDGGIYPCSYMYEYPELKIGSLRENTIMELWDNKELWDKYRNPLTPTGKCTDCDYIVHCKTGCRILSYAVSRDMGAPDPGCTYEPGKE